MRPLRPKPTTRSLSVLWLAGACAGQGTGSGKSEDRRPLPVLLQPQLQWRGGKVTHQGTAFLVRNADGQAFAVTNTHYLDFAGPPLNRVVLLDVRDGQPRADAEWSWGRPGGGGIDEPIQDFNEDLLILPIVDTGSVARSIALAEPATLAVGDRVWLPNKNGKAPDGHTKITGEVTAFSPGYVSVVLDRSIELSSQSAKPSPPEGDRGLAVRARRNGSPTGQKREAAGRARKIGPRTR